MNTLAFTVSEFCAAHGISRGTFYTLLSEGIAPVTFLVGTRRLISIEAAQKWRADMEKRTHQRVLNDAVTAAAESGAPVSGLPLINPARPDFACGGAK